MSSRTAKTIIVNHLAAPGHRPRMKPLGRIDPQLLAAAIGLISPWNAPKWIFKSERLTGTHSIRWDKLLNDGSRLTDNKSKELLETARMFLAIILFDPNDMFDVNSHETAINRAYTLTGIIDWLIFKGLKRLSDISPVDWEYLKTNVSKGLPSLAGRPNRQKRERLSASRILEIFRVFQHLRDFHIVIMDDGSRLLDDGLSFEPFSSPNDAIMLARQLGAETGRTRSIPPATALHYLDAAIQFVSDYADDIITLKRRLSRAGLETPQPSRRPPGTTLYTLAKLLESNLASQKKSLWVNEGQVDRTKLAYELGVSAPVLYAPKHAELIVRFERTINQSSFTKGEQEASSLLAELRSIPNPELTSGRSSRLVGMRAKSLGLPFTGRNGSASPWPIETVSSSRHGTRSLEAAINDLWSAVFIVIGAFMADRLSEVLEIEVDCLHHGLDGDYLESSIFKETNAKRGISNRRPCPKIVTQAVEVAIALGKDARIRQDSSKLFMAENRNGDSVPDETTIRQRLETFGKRIAVPPDELGHIWLINPHELRRFFAITWVWYFELGDGLDALKKHLRHVDVETTVRYGSSAYHGEVLGEEQREFTHDMMEKAAFNGLDLAGPAGRRIRRWFALLQVHISDPAEMADAIAVQVERKGILLHPTPWGYCMWWLGAARKAKCIKDGKLTDKWPSGRKEPNECGKCINFATHRVFQPFWSSALHRHRRMQSTAGAPKELIEAAVDGERIAGLYAGEEDDI
ncbi:site-specific integrase [Manganibacter manganicus]|uniref:Tyr recombinase domain-containing protein n=1 Tax=Manganibacter manganicus TaxID=1873176 RepID=A0A1V8RNQ3_9HYPH|nr:site-specific integrase [Pseudaminobacter manganicus]OQM74579.1 hypothetical protein BFN67_21430 [Pseudaminobacter manganicus]